MTIPWPARIVFTLWILLWAPVVLYHHGPQNFLWLCNIAQFLILYALWTGNRLILSSQAGIVIVVGAGWTLDLIVTLALGRSLTGFTEYMISPELALSARLISLYHIGLPLFLLWLLPRTGHDDRGWRLQCAIGAVVVIAGWLLTDPWRNINWVFHPFGMEQPPLPEPAWVLLLVVVYPLIFYLPGHWLVRGWVAWRLQK